VPVRSSPWTHLTLAALSLALPLSCARHRMDRSVAARLLPASAASAPGEAGAGPPSGVQFREITQEAGLRFRHVNGASGRRFYPETFGSGAAFLDYDGDGWLDILLINGRPLRDSREPSADSQEASRGSHLALYRNNGAGTFTDVTRAAGLDVPLYGMGCAVGDYDNDGDDDLYVTAALESSRLFRNERVPTGRATFTDVTAQAGVDNHAEWGTSCAWLDDDLDGYLDLFVCNYVQYSLRNEITCRNHGIKVYCGPLVYDAASCRLYQNQRNGTFKDATRVAGVYKRTGKALGVAIWDFDGDGLPEIAVANDLSPNYLFHNLGRGKFEEVGSEWGIAYAEEGMARSGMGIDVADTNHDGHPAVFISNFAREPNSFFRYEGEHLFSDQSYASGMGEVSLLALGFGLFFFDYDNDGWRDAFVTNGHIEPEIARFESPVTYAQRPFLFHNERNGTFEEVGARAGAALRKRTVGRGAAWGDFDNDGDLDILVNNNNQAAQLLRNDGGNASSWLQLRLVGGPTSNRNGFGARVRVIGGGLTQTDQARSGSSYLSQSDTRLHFGLGTYVGAVDVEVRWPSGTVDTVRGVKPKQVLTITEGQAGAR
jgi:hypothetical protein